MEVLLSYLKYNYLICFDINGDGRIHITGSSNRAIKIEELISVNSIDVDSLAILVGNVLKTYFVMKSKESDDQLSDTEKEILASIVNYFKTSKQTISQRCGISFDTAQIVFILPPDWTEKLYKNKLRSFFVETEWMSPGDDRNKLILVPFIQALAGHLQTSAENKRHLDRERSSLLFSMQPSDEDDAVTFNYTCFQMQSADELITVSKSLASSTFLLIPSIKSSESISLGNLDKVMYTAVKQILSSIQNKHPKERALEDKERFASKLAFCLPYMYDTVHKMRGYDEDLQHRLRHEYLDKHQLEELKGWSCGQFITAIFDNPHVKQYSKQVCDFFREALVEYGAVRDCPDGIQHILLYSHFMRQDYRYYIMQALVEGNVIQPGNEFIEIDFNHNDLAPYAMQKPYKMIQVANAILPPVIVNEETQENSAFQIGKFSDKLIRPNSFYVQASINANQINFILNKVIEVSPSDDTVKLFTVQERLAKIEDIAETALDLLWNHYQSLNDTMEHCHSLINACHEHGSIALSSSHYSQFCKHVKQLTVLWFQNGETFTSEGLDAFHSVSVDDQCNCALNLSQRLLMEVGLSPVVSSIATTITSTLLSDGFFGLYNISALIVRGSLKQINSHYFSCSIDRLLKEALQMRLQEHSKRVSLFYGKQINDKVAQYLGRGSYSQISSTTYVFKISVASRDYEAIHGLQEDGVCRKVFALAYHSQLKWSRNHGTMSEHLALARGDDIPLTGINTTFLVSKFSDLVTIETYVSDPSQKCATHHRLWSEDLDIYDTALCSPISIKISSEHHSSTVKISVSYLVAFIDRYDTSSEDPVVYDVEESVNIHERLFLKKHI